MSDFECLLYITCVNLLNKIDKYSLSKSSIVEYRAQRKFSVKLGLKINGVVC